MNVNGSPTFFGAKNESPNTHHSVSTQMNTLIEDMLRQRKLLLWRKILETFPIEQKHRDRITKKILQLSEADLPQRIEPPKSDAPRDDMPVAPRCSEIDM